jgi:hypothetical protein
MSRTKAVLRAEVGPDPEKQAGLALLFMFLAYHSLDYENRVHINELPRPKGQGIRPSF